MAYVFEGVYLLEGQPKVGSKQCVALVQQFAHAPLTAYWRQGQQVMGLDELEPGTAIATFVKGKYPNNKSGNHAALYLEQDAGGIWVMDQWADDVAKPRISKRYIRIGGTNPSNNALCYSVIE